MASGIKVSSDVLSAYQELKTGHKYPYIILRVSDDEKEIIVDRKGDEGETYDDFRTRMVSIAKDSCQGRYAFFDFKEKKYQNEKSGGKLLGIQWCSDCHLNVKQKMLYTSSCDSVKRACPGFAKWRQINDEDDFSEQPLRAELGLKD